MSHPPHVPHDAATHDDVDRLAARWDAETPGIAGQSFMLAARVERLHALLDAVTRDRLRTLDLTREEYALLAALRSAGHPYEGTVPSVEVSDADAAASLAARGLVEVGAGTPAVVRLTVAGEQLALSAVTAVVSGQAVALRTVPAGALQEATAALRAVLVALG
ncbi:hypothetical protein CLV28_0291 [Sediminihabitans luteus]|uniref:DNA-binding MarR family transcriptional regulator n=1 Tax=Sediminihabitans luteus TaxID=1138585 RepID=A0A2M9CYR8_9CELL|nr:hypothetical protein [Sediminihabitans luteus]PJJ77079.1 hypothetical protein CLV28_0291 [Sediminihabitans luteus]GIJ00402.1 hypothetical protein Slu03_27790 [Sediminihabitans luteus]